MKDGQRLWSRDELILAINLYIKLPFGKMHSRNEEVINLAKILTRTPSSVARKLGNFASFDPALLARGLRGLPNASKLDREIWNEFYQNWDVLFIESEREMAKKLNGTPNELYMIDDAISYVGEDATRNVNIRLNQSVFRDILLANYDGRCCVTGIDKVELLVAGHIVPWSQDKNNRLNPRNGLLLNALHDRAFEHGMITLDEDFKIRVSPLMKKKETIKSIQQNFLRFEGKSITLPRKFLPGMEFLKIHRQEKFKS